MPGVINGNEEEDCTELDVWKAGMKDNSLGLPELRISMEWKSMGGYESNEKRRLSWKRML